MSDVFRQENRSHGLAHDDLHGTPAQPLEIFDLRSDLSKVSRAITDVTDEKLTRSSKAHASGKPLENRRAEFVLQVLYPSIHG